MQTKKRKIILLGDGPILIYGLRRLIESQLMSDIQILEYVAGRKEITNLNGVELMLIAMNDFNELSRLQARNLNTSKVKGIILIQKNELLLLQRKGEEYEMGYYKNAEDFFVHFVQSQMLQENGEFSIKMENSNYTVLENIELYILLQLFNKVPVSSIIERKDISRKMIRFARRKYTAAIHDSLSKGARFENVIKMMYLPKTNKKMS